MQQDIQALRKNLDNNKQNQVPKGRKGSIRGPNGRRINDYGQEIIGSDDEAQDGADVEKLPDGGFSRLPKASQNKFKELSKDV